MSLLPDPDELLAIADRIADHAAAVRSRAHQLGHATAASGWTGVAADAFRLEADDTVAALHGAAARLDDAADALRRHAATVRHAVELVHALEQQALAAVHCVEHRVVHGVDDTTHELAHVAHLIGV